MNINWHSLQKRLHPIALGMLYTFGLCYLAVRFYTMDVDNRETSSNPLIQVAHRLDLATIDWRLRLRGPRKGSDRVVIVGIDEKALAQEGQWPWPRLKIKEMVSRLMEGGAKVVGFDVIWPESEQNTTTYTLKKLKNEIEPSVVPEQLFSKYMQLSRTDHLLGEEVRKHRDRIVLGSYFTPFDNLLGGAPLPQHGHQNLCFETFYRTTSAYQVLDTQENSLLIRDQSIPLFQKDHPQHWSSDEIPEVWEEILFDHFDAIAEKTQKEFLDSRRKKGFPEKLGKTARINLRRLVQVKQWEYCTRFLNPPNTRDDSGRDISDENWQAYEETYEEVQEDEEMLADVPFAEATRILRKQMYNSKINMVSDWTVNVPSINRGAKHTGYFNAKQDSDGTIRRSFLTVRTGQTFYPSLSLMTYMLATEQRAELTLRPLSKSIGHFRGISELALTNYDGEAQGTVPVDPEGFVMINFAGPEKMFRHLSAADILDNEPTLSTVTKKRVRNSEGREGWEEVTETHAKSDFFQDKIFVVGATAVGLYDLRVTPFQESFPGVETHANVIDNLLRKDFLKRHANEEKYMLVFLIAFGIAFTALVGSFGALVGLFTNLVTVTVLYWIDRTYFFANGWVVSIVFPFLLLFGIYAIITVYKYFSEEKNKKQLKGTFGKYVSPAIVEEILAHPDNIELGGRKEEVTVFFSDVRGFTTISETLSPTDLGDLLNDYLTPMTEIIFENRGTLDKYIGDAIMAFFGAPIHNPRHADDGCRAALQNVERLLTLQKELEARNLPHIDVGIGLNTGDVSVGNMGSNIVRNYTIMGDAVNLGARLEGITKQYGARIIVSQYTKAQMSPDFITREVDCVRVKGKLEPVRIYELLGERTAPDNMVEVVKWFDEGYQLYHQKQWEKAIRSFEKASSYREGERAKADPSSQLYIDRCRDYIQTPPPEDWDGVYVMTTK